LIFALSGVALLVALLIFGISCGTRWFGHRPAVDAVAISTQRREATRRSSSHRCRCLACGSGTSMFSWIDKRLLDDGELAEAMAAAQPFALTGGNSGVCIYRKRSGIRICRYRW